MLSAEASHLRKYLATLGIGMVAATISLAGLALRLQEDLLVKQDELQQLTPTARETIERRQDYLSVMSIILPWFVLVGCVAGIALAAYGIRGWSKRQKVADEIEDLQRDKSRTEVRSLTDTERSARIDQEVEEAVLQESVLSEGSSEPLHASEVDPHISSEFPASTTPNPPAPNLARRREIAASVMGFEAELARKINEGFGQTYRVDVGVAAGSGGRQREFDAVAFPLLPNENRPIVFEMKYVSHPKNLTQAFANGLQHVASASEIFPDGAIPVVVTIYRDEPSGDAAALQRVRERARQMANTFKSAPRTLILSAREFEEMTGSEFRNRLGL